MKRIEVQIMGQSYLLATSDEGESTLREAVTKVDTAMCQIRDAGKVKARDRIAVLAALNIAAQGLSEAPAFADAHMQNPVRAALAPDYSHLMAKLDSALGNDGQLI